MQVLVQVLYLDVFGWTSAAQADWGSRQAVDKLCSVQAQANRQSISHDASESHAAFSEVGRESQHACFTTALFCSELYQ